MNIYVEKIIQIANEKKIPLSKICTDTNINKNSFNNWKNGAEPPLDKIINIIKYLDLSADEIFEIKKNERLTPTEKSQYIKIAREQLRHVNKVIDLIESESSKDEIMQYLNGLRLYTNREIEKYNEWDKHTMD